jgi:hypothetical protein
MPARTACQPSRLKVRVHLNGLWVLLSGFSGQSVFCGQLLVVAGQYLVAGGWRSACSLYQQIGSPQVLEDSQFCVPVFALLVVLVCWMLQCSRK